MRRDPSKYRARRTTLDGIEFASAKEARHYAELKLRERAGEIRDLVLQPVFELQEGFIFDGKSVRPVTYRADFQYFDVKLKKDVVVDVKGFKTPEYKLKRKLFLFRFVYTPPYLWFIEV